MYRCDHRFEQNTLLFTWKEIKEFEQGQQDCSSKACLSIIVNPKRAYQVAP